MATAQSQGQIDLRAENTSRAVKGFALQQYRLKQVVLVKSSSSWKETYFREDATELTAGATRNVKGVPRGAEFPDLNPNWTEFSARHIKHAGKGTIFLEDKLTDSIDVMARTLIRVARAIAKSVDDTIYSDLSGATGIGTAAASDNWNSATVANQNPIDDILAGIQDMDEQNYDALQNGFLLVNPKNYRSLLQNAKVINNPSYKTADVVSNGRVGQIVGLTIIKTNSVTADEAMIIIGQRAATWQTAASLTTELTNVPGIKTVVHTWEIGVTQVTDPRAIYVITNTDV